MKKKTVSPIVYLAIIFFACIVLTLISHHVARSAGNEPQKTVSQDVKSESNDYMIWESVSHHLLFISR